MIDDVNRIVRTIFSGTVTHSDPGENNRKLRCDPAFDPTFSEIIEFEANAVVRFGSTDIMFLLKSNLFAKTSRRAIVVGSRPSIYGTARIFQLVADDHCCIRVFRTLDEAMSWLVTPCNACPCPKIGAQY